MKLYEIAEGEPIQIIASMGKNTFEFMTIVDICKGGVLFVEPIRYEDKLLNFDSDQIDVTVMYVVAGEKPMIWEKCVVRYIQMKTQKYHAIICKRDGRQWNRRYTFREYLGMTGFLVSETSRKRWDVIVKDISTEGVAFVIHSGDVSMENIGDFHLEFEDRENHLNIHLNGTVVREEIVDENKKVFGAALKKSNIDVGMYILQKQRKDIARRRGN